MSDTSPLFVSALELLAHATELYAMGQVKKYKFSILHLANAIELILKDCLVDHGVSIYKNPKETITIWGAFEELDKLKIRVPERPVIELLVDDRNTIQHRFGFPNGEAVFYYLEQVVAFFRRFVEEQYQVNLAEALDPHLSKDNLALIGLVNDDYGHLRRLFRLSPEAAIQQAYTTIDVQLRELADAADLWSGSVVKRATPLHLFRVLAEHGDVDAKLAKDFDIFREARNRAAHFASSDNNDVDWEAALKAALRLIERLDQLARDIRKRDDGLADTAA